MPAARVIWRVGESTGGLYRNPIPRRFSAVHVGRIQGSSDFDEASGACRRNWGHGGTRTNTDRNLFRVFCVHPCPKLITSLTSPHGSREDRILLPTSGKLRGIQAINSQKSQRSLSFDSRLKGGEEEVSARYSSIMTIHPRARGVLSHGLRFPYAGINFPLQNHTFCNPSSNIGSPPVPTLTFRQNRSKVCPSYERRRPHGESNLHPHSTCRDVWRWCGFALSECA
jgi:hypothetical protein